MIATTRAALIRGTGADALGDEIESTDAVTGWEDFPVSIIERETTAFDAASGEPRTVRKIKARMAGDVPVQDGDRLKDLRTGAIYAFDGFRRVRRGLAGRSSVTMSLTTN